jgi:hypothetical protein
MTQSPLKKSPDLESIVPDLEEAIALMIQIERDAAVAWLKAVNQKARELDGWYTSNQHIPNERLDPLIRRYAADDIAEYKELAKANPVRWYLQQRLYKEETAKSPLSQVQNSPIDEKPKMRQLEMF